MDKRDFAFGRMNFILLAAGMLVVVIGFILMGGAGSTQEAFNPDIFSVRRIKVAPLVCLFGFVSMIYAVIYRPKNEAYELESPDTASVNEPSTEPKTKVG